VTVTLKDGIKFHNGDPITAEDAAWSYNFFFSNPQVYDVNPISNAEEPQLSEPWGFIDVVDDRTFRFNLSEPSPIIETLTLVRWPILHSKSWREQGAEEDADFFEPDPYIGSGPLEVVEHETSSSLRLRPSPVEHPRWNPDHDVALLGFQSNTAQTQALKAGEIDVVMEVSLQSFKDEVSNADNLTVVEQETLGTLPCYAQCDVAPTKFKEFRAAFSATLDREKFNQLVYGGEATPQFAGTLLARSENGSHPWRGPEDRLKKFTTNPAGEPEKARQMLADNGWGWDDNGNLHYPPDADLTPVWPKGTSSPDPDQFPCLNGDGEYVPPDER
jgi:peptide/nickel transport system substrate-binding protein